MSVVIDLNCFGASDSKEKIRQCPVGTDIIKKFIKSVILARQQPADIDAVEQLEQGLVFILFDGGRERKRLFLKPLSVEKKVKDPNRNTVRCVTVFCSEESVRARRSRVRGHVKLTQNMYIVKNNSTKIPNVRYSTYPGSTASDVLGPVSMDKVADLFPWGKCT